LRAANQELEAFSYSVSHDLRAPLRSIDGFSQALLEDYADKLDRDGKVHLERVRAAAQRMALLIDDLLNLSRVARHEMRQENLDLSELARSVAADLARREPQRHVDVTVAPNLTAQGDMRLMRSVFENLIGNSWKFTSKRESARIEVGLIQIDGTAAFFVRDNGAGFDQAHAGRLFGAFQRLHGMAEFPGTGVGLASVQRIIHKHGGRIWAQGAVGKGATFYFTLPKPMSLEEETHDEQYDTVGRR
jgi:light-regulated signal transduction histidine kinase (bacteriophytochrome)